MLLERDAQVTDRHGRYRRSSARKPERRSSYHVWSYVPDRYLTVMCRSSNGKGLGEIVVDFDVPRGVIVSGRAPGGRHKPAIVSAHAARLSRYGARSSRGRQRCLLSVCHQHRPLAGKPTGLYFEGFPTGPRRTTRFMPPSSPTVVITLPSHPDQGYCWFNIAGMPMFAEAQVWKESDGLHRLFPYMPLAGRARDDRVPWGDPQDPPRLHGPDSADKLPFLSGDQSTGRCQDS